jgi:hypothetical protein
MTWSERLAHMAKFQKGDYFTHHVPGFVADKLEAHNQRNAASAVQVAHMIAKLLLTRGPAYVRETFAPIRHVLPQAVAGYLATCDLAVGSLAPTVLDLSNATNAFEIVGFDVPPSVLESFRRYLPAVEDFREYFQWRLEKGFAALALNDRRVWAPVAGYLPDQPIPFTPRETFEFNLQGLLAHLGAARLAGANFEDVRPAWWSFMACADALLDTNQMNEDLILWVARIVYHHIAEQPLGEVGELLHTSIQRCVAAGI